MKRRFAALLLVGTMVFSLTACGEGETSQKSDSENVQSTQEAEPETVENVDAENEPVDANATQNADGNILIAYFSMPEDIDTNGIDAYSGASVVVKDGEIVGNMQFMAESIQQAVRAVGGDLFRIETEEAYPLDHDPLVEQASDEQKEDARPALSTQIENLEQYDTIFVGYPKLVYGLERCIECIV